MEKVHLSLLAAGLMAVACFSCLPSRTQEAVVDREKTVMQVSSPWEPGIDIRCDVAIVYGATDSPDMTFEQRVQSWRDRGYVTHYMSGIAWGGSYRDFFTGKWDGKPHLDVGQVRMTGDTVWHGEFPYIVPTREFLKYLKEEHITKVIDAGIDAIYLEEPEFFAYSGYSEAFKREYEEYYGFPWRPQHESPENTYLSNKLKYHLYYRAIEDVCTFAKEYGKSKGINVRCYIPTHSLVNYAVWQVVSPEASLASLPCIDGYQAQIWTGTAREPVYYKGVEKPRVFENALLEYGSMESMTRPTGRKLYFNIDPIEDIPHDWNFFKRGYEATFVAQMMYPSVDNYEVLPWPGRIYYGTYRTRADSEEREKIPRWYSSQIQVMMNSLNFMPKSDNKVSGSHGIGVVMANSLMFQRRPLPTAGQNTSHHSGELMNMSANSEDPQLSGFYGQALPLLMRGVPVSIVHLENVGYPAAWEDIRLLILSYTNMKPMDPESHRHIAEWVRKGGVLVYCSRDSDDFQTVREWWNTDGNRYQAPSDHLFEQMGIAAAATEGTYAYGKGTVCVIRKDPKEFVMEPDNDQAFVDAVSRLYEQNAKGGPLVFKNSFYLERGPFNLIAVMEEGVNGEPYVATGSFIDLFDSQLPVLTRKEVLPGEQAYLYDLSRIPNRKKPQVLATAARVYDEQSGKNTYSFLVKSPVNTTNVMRVLLPAQPETVRISDAKGQPPADNTQTWDAASKTCFLSFENDPDGIHVEFTWK
ncbi:MAG: hypothetical protein LBQ73_07440 [Tannerellaceae bacterium]|jgi:hypothetical protein|nr:hypothetical protein [Tannerellaceae bacterium]